MMADAIRRPASALARLAGPDLPANSYVHSVSTVSTVSCAVTVRMVPTAIEQPDGVNAYLAGQVKGTAWSSFLFHYTATQVPPLLFLNKNSHPEI
ncbi:unnamed protein product [Nippostrongylus brasiliensis]|uniref:Secreted protein n=1 Tax=Nippostrongylus brasiliensis TaxID=27835 RepID=A0A0N4XRI7_NIPBR|nr:unnamed protein product [Nippostrongylus brasiliensis]